MDGSLYKYLRPHPKPGVGATEIHQDFTELFLNTMVLARDFRGLPARPEANPGAHDF
jgi:hypothetical protein